MNTNSTKVTDVGYAVLITYPDPEDNTSSKSIILDTVEDSTITTTSVITEHPTVDGTPMADHMYRNPTTINLRGVFSLNGKKAFVVNKQGMSLMRVEELFERIKNDGILCTITKVKVENEQQVPQFTVRQNMVLQSITWTESTNNLGFSFTFQEVLRANVQEAIADPDDQFAPSIEFAESTNFFDVLVKWEDIDAQVLQALYEEQLLSTDFLEAVGAFGQTILAAVCTVAIVALIVACASNPIGWIVGAIAVGIFFIYRGIVSIIRFFNKRKYKVDAFKAYKNKTKLNNEITRFGTFVQQVHDQIATLENVIDVWKVNAEGNQEAIINVDSSYYTIEFEKRNISTDGHWSIICADMNGRVLTSTSNTCAKLSYYDCSSANALFTAENGSYVHLILADTEHPELASSYFIVVSSIKPEDFTSALSDIIYQAIKY